MRQATQKRKTKETSIDLAVALDQPGKVAVNTGIGFFDHMLTLMATHALLGLKVRAKGDLQVDDHHTVEDVGIALGGALKEALGDKRGLTRYGWALVPMDEALAMCALDFSGRGLLVLELGVRAKKVGNFEVELVEEFLCALTRAAGLTLHLKTLAGRNSHHIIEAAFKALGRALAEAIKLDPKRGGAIPSSKGVL